MNDYNEQEKCTDDKCITCSLTEEFGLMIKDGVHWENALRHILDVALTKDEEFLSDLLDESYGIGFHDGIMFGVEQSQKALDSVHDYMSSKIAEDELNDFDNEGQEYEITLSDEDSDDEIQRIIKNN
ncbi:hypothetical protein [Bacillus sp. FJAT-22090]|uniref:hypothetical protein n=1 Tax=Bacillus sp. FJAT-22090 TaxID=1581038 RepID=UPI0011A37B04|nr:hypothetical protein [Bacillus sp. FJAT-22090]